MSLQRFIATHREELLRRTRGKLARRSAPHTGAELEHGVPVLFFLSRLARALDDVQRRAGPPREATEPDPATNEAIARSARLHGQDLSKLGFTIEQVVAEYGEVCQAVTELALELDATVTSGEFHTLDRCLDDAIAEAVTSWNDRAHPAASPRAALVQTASGGMVEAERETVLVVDRDPHVRRLVQQFVSEAYTVEFLDDGRSALDRVRRSPPSALVTEILIPQLDGLALCRLVKADPGTRHVPILVFSTLAANDRARRSGADAFLAKPLEKRRLVASLRGLTNPRAAGASPLREEQGAA